MLNCQLRIAGCTLSLVLGSLNNPKLSNTHFYQFEFMNLDMFGEVFDYEF
jgi:hypothetical protein